MKDETKLKIARTQSMELLARYATLTDGYVDTQEIICVESICMASAYMTVNNIIKYADSLEDAQELCAQITAQMNRLVTGMYIQQKNDN